MFVPAITLQHVYKHVMVVSEATMLSVTLESSFMIVNYDHNAFTVHGVVATIVNYDHNMFIVQVTGLIFLGKARSTPLLGGSESFSFWIGSGLLAHIRPGWECQRQSV